MISFYPGPSRIHDEIPEYVNDAVKTGILSANHRSPAFTALCEKTIRLLRVRLNIPEDYTVFFTSSATECWEIIAQSLIARKSIHLYNGAFGQKWFDYTTRLRAADWLLFDIEQSIDPSAIRADSDDLICITQNETSNGTQVSDLLLGQIREAYPHVLTAVDATSSLAGVELTISNADVWFASVQKCFGLPAGLGLMLCSPRAIERALAINEHAHYNSVTFMKQMMDKWQTSYTPNVMGIYLLMRVMKDSKPIAEVASKVHNRYEAWIDFLGSSRSIRHLVSNEAVRSHTVIPVAAEPALVTRIKADAREKGLLLGEGYGAWKEGTFRIANFPALKKREIRELMGFLKKY